MPKAKAVFLKVNGHLTNKNHEFNIIKPQVEKMTEKLVWYIDVEFIRTSLKKDNYVDYIVFKEKEEERSGKKNSKVKKEIEYLSEYITLKKLIEELPDYFMRISRSEIINLNYIIGKSQTHIFTKNNQFNIGKTYVKKVRQKLNSFFGRERENITE